MTQEDFDKSAKTYGHEYFMAYDEDRPEIEAEFNKLLTQAGEDINLERTRKIFDICKRTGSFK